jgi:hypothetical protein
MPPGGLQAYFQLLGSLFLATETAYLIASILLGILAAIFCFCWDMLLLAFSVLTGFGLLLIAAWWTILKRGTNTSIYAFMKKNIGSRNLSLLMRCEKC